MLLLNMTIFINYTLLQFTSAQYPRKHVSTCRVRWLPNRLGRPNNFIPDSYGYIPTSLMSIGWVLVWQTFLVGRYRGKAGVHYPQSALHLYLTFSRLYAPHSVRRESRSPSFPSSAPFQLHAACVFSDMYNRVTFCSPPYLGAHQNTLESAPLVFIS